MADKDTALLLGGGLALFCLLGRGSSASASDGGGGYGDTDWSAWQDADEVNLTPDVRPPPKRRPGGDGPRHGPSGPPGPPPLPGDDRPRGPDGGLYVDSPGVRPSSPGEIRGRLGREPTDAELLAFEQWARANRPAADLILNREAGIPWTAKPAAKRPVAVASKGDAAGAARAAKLASAAQPVPAKQAQGNKVSAALRQLALPKAKAKAAPRLPPRLPVVASKPSQNIATKPSQRIATKRVAAPAGTNVALAKSTAPDVATHVRKLGSKYKAQVVKQFQQRAGMKPDGLYGPATASALRYFGANAPAPLFKGVNAKYVPPT